MMNNITHMSPQEIRMLALDAPALAHPKDVIVNFENPENLRNDTVTISLLVISTVLVWLRLFTKWRIVKKVALEDYVLLVAWIVYAGGYHYYIFKIHMLPNGVHQWNLKVGDFIEYMKVYHYGAILYSIAMIPLKCAIILQSLRLFVPAGTRDLTFWACHVLLWTTILTYLSLIFIEAFSCHPLEAIWDVTVDGECIDRLSLHNISAAFNTLTDICVLILPQRAIWSMKAMETKKKVGLSVLFLLGICACASSIARLYYTVRLYSTDDITYYMGLMGIWTEPELACGFVAVSAPLIPKFFCEMKNSTVVQKIATLSGQQTKVQPEQSSGKASIPRGPPKVVITDHDFLQLVMKTDASLSEDTIVVKEDELEKGDEFTRVGKMV